MRVLVVSHNVFCETGSMGKTLTGYFNGWDKNQIAQFYIHSEVPTSDKVCQNYFRITDMEAVKSVFSRKCGRTFSETDIEQGRTSSRTDSGKIAEAYQKGRQRTPLIYLARNLIWRFSAWNNKKLNNWIDDFAPEVVFFASGDYAFTYRIALKIAKKRNIPLIISCMDDYYLYNNNENKLLGRFAHKLFMKQVRKTIAYADALVCICDKMSQDYKRKFNVDCYTMHTPTSFKIKKEAGKSYKLSYIGNMGYSRHLQLVQVGRALKSLDSANAPKHIDVYSAEAREEILMQLTEENGIVFHGLIDSEKVRQIIAESTAVIHTESFDEDIINRVKYSVSTKIADSLASGTCILAYGPSQVASIEYLQKNNAAYCITNSNNLADGLTELFENENLRQKIIDNALALAEKNHMGQSCEILADVFRQAKIKAAGKNENSAG